VGWGSAVAMVACIAAATLLDRGAANRGEEDRLSTGGSDRSLDGNFSGGCPLDGGRQLSASRPIGGGGGAEDAENAV